MFLLLGKYLNHNWNPFWRYCRYTHLLQRWSQPWGGFYWSEHCHWSNLSYHLQVTFIIPLWFYLSWVMTTVRVCCLGLSVLIFSLNQRGQFSTSQRGQLSNWNSYFYWFWCHHPLITQLSFIVKMKSRIFQTENFLLGI